MDILASILAYLGCMTGIVGALLISFMVLFSAPDQLPNIKQTMVKQPAPMATKVGAPSVATTTSVADATAAPGRHTRAASARSKILAVRTQKWRRYVQEERARRWAYQQDPDFDSRFLGYAD